MSSLTSGRSRHLLHHHAFKPLELIIHTLVNVIELRHCPFALQYEQPNLHVVRVATEMQKSVAKVLNADTVILLYVKQLE